MKDIKFDRDFQIIIDDRNDLATVSGREAFEQDLAITLTAFFYEEIGTLRGPESLERIRMQAERVARFNDQLEGIISMDVTESIEHPNAAELNIIYSTGDDFTMMIEI